MSERTVKVNLVAQATGYVSGMDAAAKKTREVGSEAEKLAQKAQGLQTLGMAGVAVGVAITGIGLAALKTGIQYNTLQQTSRAALKTILGGAEAANAQMDKLDDFARNSPFAKQTFIQAQQQMLAFGVETKKVIPYLDAVQNAVAAAGGSNAEIAGIVATMSKIQSASKLTGQDLIEFGNRGINAAELIGSQMGKTGAQIREEITAGSLGATEALDALTAGMSEKFAGASANVKQTFEGSIDRVKAAWRDFSSELAKPLVDPNGGGALIDLLNWTADAMRGFQSLPVPVKEVTTVLIGLVGVTALLGGTALLAVPKIAAFKVAMETLNVSGGAAAGKLKSVASFLTGPWGVALAAAAIGVVLLTKYVDDLKASTGEYQNVIKNAKSADDLFEVSDKGRLISRLDEATASAGVFQEKLNKISTNGFLTGLDLSAQQLQKSLKDLGGELATTAQSDLPGAQKAFRLLAEDMGLNADQQMQLLDGMPKYKEALIEQASQLGVNVTSSDEAANKTNLLKLAFGGAASSGVEAADAYLAAAEETAGLDDKLKSLVDTLNEANGVGQDAISQNIAYQSALADVDEQIAKIAAGTEGYAGGLNVSTEAGRTNLGMLNDLAGSSQDAAQAQFDLDGNTENYRATLEAGRQAVIDRAIALGATADEAKNLADKIYAIPSEKQFNMIAETGEAAKRLQRIQDLINGIGATSTLHISTAPGRGGMTMADGGAIGYAGGGHIRGVGGPRQDNIPIWASAGEHMFDAEDVKRMGGQEAVYRFRDSLSKMQSAPPQYASAGGGGGSGAGFTVVLGQKGGVDLLKYVDVQIQQNDRKQASVRAQGSRGF